MEELKAIQEQQKEVKIKLKKLLSKYIAYDFNLVKKYEDYKNINDIYTNIGEWVSSCDNQRAVQLAKNKSFEDLAKLLQAIPKKPLMEMSSEDLKEEDTLLSAIYIIIFNDIEGELASIEQEEVHLHYKERWAKERLKGSCK
jgi:hypothetical protein